MGTFQSNLDKISLKCSAKAKGVVGATLFGFCYALLLGNVHNVEAKSLSWSPSTYDTTTDDKYTFDSTTTRPSTTTPSSIKHVVLDVKKDPEVIWYMKEDAVPTRFNISKESKDFRIAIHLKDCDFETGDYIEIKKRDEVEGEKWWCAKKTITSDAFSSYNFVDEYTQRSGEKHSGDKYVTAHEVMDNLKEVWIIPHMNAENHGTKKEKWKKKVKATVIINLYRDISGSNNCPDDLFDCHQALCPTTCCSDVSSESGSSNHETKTASTEPFIFTSTVWSKKSQEVSRCIPNALKCNDNPNCGMHTNIDERNQICHTEKYCTCQTVCLTWNYVLTSLAIAILFIITPTAIVFALFHRRNVALERARLIRLAQMRMADLRGDFTREDPTNDVPPTYDEVYDIKDPPPCFCKAVAMQKEHDLQQQRESSTEDAPTVGSTVVQNDGEESSSVEFQNMGFQCSCANVSRDDGGDIPPSYGEVSTGENEVDVTSDVNTNNNNDAQRRSGDAPNAVQVDSSIFENVDLEKEEEV